VVTVLVARLSVTSATVTFLRYRLQHWINPTWGKDILGNVATMLALYTPILAAASKDGVSDRAIWPTGRTRFIG
jgi:hypothetical protein